MQHLRTLAFQRAAGGHLLGRRVSPSIENRVGRWYFSLANRPATIAVGYQEYLLQYHSCNLQQCDFAGMDDHPLWKLVTCRGWTHLSVPKSHLQLLQVTFSWDVTCPILMDVSLAFLLPSWAFRKLGTCPVKVRCDQTAWCPLTPEYLPMEFAAHSLEKRAPCPGCSVHAGVGFLMGHPREAPEPHGAAEWGQIQEKESGWELLHGPTAPGGAGTLPGGRRELLAHLHKAGRLQTLVLSP